MIEEKLIFLKYSISGKCLSIELYSLHDLRSFLDTVKPLCYEHHRDHLKASTVCAVSLQEEKSLSELYLLLDNLAQAKLRLLWVSITKYSIILICNYLIKYCLSIRARYSIHCYVR
jgi:hypothetical protein